MVTRPWSPAWRATGSTCSTSATSPAATSLFARGGEADAPGDRRPRARRRGAHRYRPLRARGAARGVRARLALHGVRRRTHGAARDAIRHRSRAADGAGHALVGPDRAAARAGP